MSVGVPVGLRKVVEDGVLNSSMIRSERSDETSGAGKISQGSAADGREVGIGDQVFNKGISSNFGGVVWLTNSLEAAFDFHTLRGVDNENDVDGGRIADVNVWCYSNLLSRMEMVLVVVRVF